VVSPQTCRGGGGQQWIMTPQDDLHDRSRLLAAAPTLAQSIVRRRRRYSAVQVGGVGARRVGLAQRNAMLSGLRSQPSNDVTVTVIICVDCWWLCVSL
jgi:hypothetical protein